MIIVWASIQGSSPSRPERGRHSKQARSRERRDPTLNIELIEQRRIEGSRQSRLDDLRDAARERLFSKQANWLRSLVAAPRNSLSSAVGDWSRGAEKWAPAPDRGSTTIQAGG